MLQAKLPKPVTKKEQQGRYEGRNPGQVSDLGEGFADDGGRQVRIEKLQLGQRGKRRRREVQHEDEQQRPRHRLPRLPDRRRREVPLIDAAGVKDCQQATDVRMVREDLRGDRALALTYQYGRRP